MGTEMYDDSAKGGYSYAEKLACVADGLMDPKEIGMASAEEAQLRIEPQKRPVFGTTLLFRAGVVPLELRAEWASQDERKTRKIIGPDHGFDKDRWMREHANEFPIQADLHCGQANAKFGQTFADPVLGLCAMLRAAADRLEKAYTEADEPQVATPTDTANETTDSSSEKTNG